ncbi:MAG: hypothetical protein IPP17_17055 [Bacteroidetes bacterium]|nr:hypothetical protein [Bacteroidota bacterium]
MEIQAIANLFSALRDGEIQDLRMEDQNLQFRVHLPQLAALRGEGFQYFLCAFQGLKALSFQPFRNDSTEIKDLNQINKLQIQIVRAEVGEGNWIRVMCSHKGSQSGARLSLQGASMSVWDETFDAVSAADLSILRGKSLSKP